MVGVFHVYAFIHLIIYLFQRSSPELFYGISLLFSTHCMNPDWFVLHMAGRELSFLNHTLTHSRTAEFNEN